MEEEEPDNGTAKLLVLTHGSQADVWSMDLVVEVYGPGPLAPGDVKHGLLKIQDIVGDVMDGAFSPDGSALATASGDGQVKFFQVYLQVSLPSISPGVSNSGVFMEESLSHQEEANCQKMKRVLSGLVSRGKEGWRGTW
jgi:WD40 repeat protein